MDLEIVDIRNKGEADKERVLLKARDDCDTADYILFDTTYTEDGEVSNEFRHAFRFPSIEVKEGEYVRVYSKTRKQGSYRRSETEKNQVIHDFYWGLDDDGAIWNDDGDCALLIEILDSDSMPVGKS